MKTILITVPTLLPGGMERAAVNFAEVLANKGFKVHLFLISSSDVFYEIPTNVLIFFGKKNLKKKWQTPYSLWRLRKHVRLIKPDYVLSFSGKISSYIILALTGLPTTVVPFHRGSPYKTYGWFNNVLNELLFPKCKALVVQTNVAKVIFEKKFKNRNIIVVPNPVRKLNLNPEVPKKNFILAVSRLVDGKGLDRLIKIFANIDPAGWELIIVGDGPSRNKLEKLIASLGMTDKVKLEGFKKDVDQFFSQSSIFAFTSESEGFPNSLLEAMCSGNACISFDCPTGPAEMIKDGINGYLIPLTSDGLYEEKLRHLIEDKHLRELFGERAKQLNIAHSPQNVLDNFVDMLISKTS